MKKSWLTLIFLFNLIPYSGFCQLSEIIQNIECKGLIKDQESKNPLPYASIGLLNTPYGTLSDSLGRYNFQVEKFNPGDSIQISLLGYVIKRIDCLEFFKTSIKEIFLNKKIQMLAEVRVSDKEMKTEIIGRQSSSMLTQVSLHKKGAANETVGSEFGIKIKSEHSSAILKNFNWFISNNNFKSIKFRINVYSVKNDLPDTLVCRNQITITLKHFQTGWSRINLEEYGIHINGEVIVTLQWLEGITENNKNPTTIIPVAITPFSSNCYSRTASQDKWTKFDIKPSCYATIIY